VYAVREELAWARLESLSTAVVALVKERKEAQEISVPGIGEASGSAPLADDVPPRYSFEQRGSISEAGLPTYAPGHQHDENPTDEKTKSSVHTPVSASTPTSAPREKMLLELDGLADAIGRLHSVTPRLNDQRVEFRPSSSKSATMPADLRARAEREKVRELELIWDQIERTHGKRRMKDVQRVDMAGWEDRRAKQVRFRLYVSADGQKKHYLESLFDKTDGNRLEGQDSVKGKVDAELARARDLRDVSHLDR